MDYRSMGQIFKGLSQAGAWGCFDEFNRIDISVLSVVSTQWKCILDAIRLFASFMKKQPRCFHCHRHLLTIFPKRTAAIFVYVHSPLCIPVQHECSKKNLAKGDVWCVDECICNSNHSYDEIDRRGKRTRFTFEDEDIILNHSPFCSAYITMNPGYAGRTELPESVKALFRPCAMIVPDMDLICEVRYLTSGWL
jgi:hypothetical protein